MNEETQAIFAEYERINLAQAQEIARLNKVLLRIANCSAAGSSSYTLAEIASANMSVVPTGDNRPAETEVKSDEKGN